MVGLNEEPTEHGMCKAPVLFGQVTHWELVNEGGLQSIPKS